MTEGAGVDEAGVPMPRQAPDMGGLGIGIVVAGDDDHRYLRRQRRRVGEAVDAAVAAQLRQVGRRDEQRAGDAVARDAARRGKPVRERMAAEAVRRDEDGFVLGVDRCGDSFRPTGPSAVRPSCRVRRARNGRSCVPTGFASGSARCCRGRGWSGSYGGYSNCAWRSLHRGREGEPRWRVQPK